jgi:hypothetical protein
LLLWNHASADPIRAAEAPVKLEAREARLLGLDMPSKFEVTEEANRIPLAALRELMNRAEREPIHVTPASEGERLLSNGTVHEDFVTATRQADNARVGLKGRHRVGSHT